MFSDNKKWGKRPRPAKEEAEAKNRHTIHPFLGDLPALGGDAEGVKAALQFDLSKIETEWVETSSIKNLKEMFEVGKSSNGSMSDQNIRNRSQFHPAFKLIEVDFY